MRGACTVGGNQAAAFVIEKIQPKKDFHQGADLPREASA